mmetsp:Transcript_52039/g.111295  ORF Transcript_52039/g.111295 Transcript_52039/m.111295 type:complete len:224 (-) Transcript_52039:175-846(-)
MLPPTGMPLSLTHDVPLSEEMHGVCPMYGHSALVTASRQKAATSAREMEPASPLITLTMPLGGSMLNPPGRTTVNSRSEPGPSRKSFSWLFLSSKILRITVIMSTLKKKGAWFSESPAPMEVTTAMRLMPPALHASMTLRVPSVSIDSPTSAVLPPSATTTPLTSPNSKTLATSTGLVTSPCITRKLSSRSGDSEAAPPEPAGTSSRAGLRTKQFTFCPRPSA